MLTELFQGLHSKAVTEKTKFSQTCIYPSVVLYHSSKPHNHHSFELLELLENIVKITMVEPRNLPRLTGVTAQVYVHAI